jgi:hypothetical protein
VIFVIHDVLEQRIRGDRVAILDPRGINSWDMKTCIYRRIVPDPVVMMSSEDWEKDCNLMNRIRVCGDGVPDRGVDKWTKKIVS